MSDSNMSAPGTLVLGTAGHIDHGKTALVRALTGTDTDRLPEEKRRGISIDLGFAHLTLPSGELISFVDVPGHERFVRNMLAGVAGIQAVLLIVAADEGVKPQTREHFEICRLLGIEHGLIAITKSDLADEEQMRRTRSAIAGLASGSFLDGAATLAVSAKTGAGLEMLKVALVLLARRARMKEEPGIARLPIDRAFALKGFGTVVTGTLSGESLGTGDVVRLHPGGQQARIRGLQAQGHAIQTANAGQRTAVNLSGVEISAMERGVVLAREGLESTEFIHASMQWLTGCKPPAKQELLMFHSGTAEVTAHLKNLVNTGEFAQVKLSKPVLLLPGDRFILRKPSPAETVAGGVVLDAFPPAKLNAAKACARLLALREASFVQKIELLVGERENGRTVVELARWFGKSQRQIRSAVSQSAILALAGEQHVITHEWLERRRTLLIQYLERFHTAHLAAAGAPIAASRLGLEPALADFVVAGFTRVKIQGDVIALTSHTPQLSERERAALDRVEQAFRKAGHQPPNAGDVLKESGLDEKTGRWSLDKLIKTQKLFRISQDLVFHAEVITQIRRSLAAQKGRRFSVPEFKEWTRTSRKHAIPLLEYLDLQRVTRREGDSRIVL